MELSAYAVEAEIEEKHWWFVARRDLFSREIVRLGAAHNVRVLDIGTSTGTNLRMLRQLGFSRITGLDVSDEAISYCAAKGFGMVERGDVCAMPFADESFDLVLATDVIEHVDDDGRAVAEIRRVLAPGGKVLITVPAFTALWGLQDEVAHHKRRYRRAPLRSLVERAGFRIVSIYYFNFLLFAPIWLARRAIGLAGIRLESEARVNLNVLNRILYWIFYADTRLSPMLKPPFGVSILVAGAK